MGILFYVLFLSSFLISEGLDNNISIPPRLENEFNLSIPFNTDWRGRVNVTFTVDEKGQVINPIATDTFDSNLNEMILSAVRQLEFSPAYQNGHAVKIKYHLPIVIQ